MADQSPVSAVVPGYKTTEFYLSLGAMILSVLYSSGVISSGGLMDKVLGLGASVLAALGYTVGRSIVKSKSQ